MDGQELLNLSSEKQQEYVQNFTKNALNSFDQFHKVMSSPGVTFTRTQRFMIYCLRDNLNIFGTIKKWMIQKFILNREKR